MKASLEQRRECAAKLEANAARVKELSAFLGLDGFVDKILHVVDKRESAESYTRVQTIAQFAERIAAAAGKSTNIELVKRMEKLGGNGPIMGNALAALGVRVTYVGCLGWPELHPVFREFAERAEVHTIADPGLTDAYEFTDGKLLFGLHESLREVNWENIRNRWSREEFERHLAGDSMAAFVNWTMLPYMSEVWEAVLEEVVPNLPSGPRRPMFFDLADPEKRTSEDIRRAFELIVRFGERFDVTLGLNEKEAYETAKALGLGTPESTPEGLSKLALQIAKAVPVKTLVIHPVAYALAVSEGKVALTPGPVTDQPLITTGAGDHFNSGFCLGKLLGLDDMDCLLTAVTASGFYVRTAKSPSTADLAATLRDPEIAYGE
ncbi:MAG: hypothetical protein J7M29_00490 [Verrucomicrobia bacterium]|nr:hypothetical protein [Verrucomicrobiota bacterium]